MNKLMADAQNWDNGFSEIPLEPGEVVAFETGGVLSNGDLIPMDQSSRGRLFGRIGAPARYFETHSARFQAALNEHAARGDFGRRPTLVVREGRLATIIRGELLSLPNAVVLRAVEEELGKESESLIVARIGSDLERLDVDLISPSKEIAVRPGDIVRSGLHIVHERFGNQATVVEAFIYRLVCRNGGCSPRRRGMRGSGL